MEKTVIILEDEPCMLALYKAVLSGKVALHIIPSVPDFDKMCRQGFPDFHVAIVDACLGGREVNAIPLMKKLREFKAEAPIFAASSNYNADLLEAGADQAFQKCEVAQAVLRFLGKN